MTCLGGAFQAAAAARAGILRLRELDGVDYLYLDQDTNAPTPLVGHPISGITSGFAGIGRLVRLSALALEDLKQAAGVLPPADTGFFLALPTGVEPGRPAPQDPTPLEPDNATEDDGTAEANPHARMLRPLTEREARKIATQACDAAGLMIADAATRTYAAGKSGLATALTDAVAALERRQLARAIVCATDSELDLPRIRASFASGRLKTLDKAVGFLPGEAAACLLIEQPDSVSQGDRLPCSLLASPSLAQEEAPDDPARPPTGRALSDAIFDAISGANASDSAAGTAYLELNGETHRAIDWGNALVRLRARCRLDAWMHATPAVSFGDTGLVSPLLALCLAARAYVRGYAVGDVSLILGCAEAGHRFAVAARRP
jgi:3-oxoacyl-[acyl-carrier-protein] synthase-1